MAEPAADTAALLDGVDAALGRVEALPPDCRETALDAVSELLALYGEGWRRAMRLVRERSGPNVAARLADDDLIRHLLAIHGLDGARPAGDPAPLVQLEGVPARAGQ